jgi:hypothetical protein
VRFSGRSVLNGIEVAATRSATVQPAGPRQGESGSRSFNVEGSKNDRCASFDVLAFEIPKGSIQAGDVEQMSLRLVQSIPRFAKDGKVRFFLAESPDRGGDQLPGLKFDSKSPNGGGKDAFKALHPQGSGTFKKLEAGHADTFELRPDDAGQELLSGSDEGGRDDPDRHRAGRRGGRGDLFR